MKISRRAKLFSFITAFVLLISFMFSFTSSAKTYDESKINSKYAVVYNIENDMFVFEKNANEHISPAGLAKIMTAIIALEHYKNIERDITVTSNALSGLEGTGVLGLLNSEKISAKDLIYTMLVGGCNDSANVIAYDISGNIASFSEKMNKKAQEIGLSDTVFKNPTGLDVPGAYTTAKDAVKLVSYAMKNDIFKDAANTAKYTVEDTNKHSSRTVYTKNYFLSKQTQSIYYWKEAEGISMSYTDSFGYMLISSLSEYSLSYICVCSGATRNANGRIYAYDDVKNLLTWAVKEYKTTKVLDESKIFGEIKVTLSDTTDHVSVVPGSSLYAFLPHDTDIENEIKYKYEIYEKELEAPIEKGKTVGKIDVYRNETKIASCDLVTKTNAARSGFLAFKAALFGKTSLIMLISVILAAVLFGIIRYFVFLAKSKK